MGGRRRTILHLQKKLHVYLERREHYKNTLGTTSKQYINTKRSIDSFRQQLKSHQTKEEIIKFTDSAVHEFIGYKPSTIINPHNNKEKALAKNIFYKYCIEHGVSGYTISRYMGLKTEIAPTRCRLNFTRSFKTCPSNLEMWRRFKSFIKDYNNETANT